MKKRNKNFQNTIANLSKHYDDLVEKYGNNVKSSQQSNKKTRDTRLLNLIKYVNLKKKITILDFGCGTGYLFSYLKSQKFIGFYKGIDISNQAILKAKKVYHKHKNCNFEALNIFNSPLKKKFDYVIINGTFNNNTKNNWQWMKKSLKILIKSTKKKIIFNNLSIYVDNFDKKLFYIHPNKVFNFVKHELNKTCILDHSYRLKKNVLPYEFTTVIFKDE